MALQSNDADGPFEFAKLLELLNTSEERRDTANVQHELEVPSSGTPDSDPIMLPEDSPDLVGNRLAAHIVRGLSKMNER